ncbi:hypothetical protein M959_10329, partial [Chaetura pelagica]
EPPELQGTMSPFLSLSQSVAGQAPERRPQELEVSRLLRPSDLPLQPDTRQSRETASSCRYHGDLSTKKLSHFLPLGETESELPTGFSFSCSPEKRTKCKPIGIAQGMPQHPNGSTSAVQSPECC